MPLPLPFCLLFGLSPFQLRFGGFIPKRLGILRPVFVLITQYISCYRRCRRDGLSLSVSCHSSSPLFPPLSSFFSFSFFSLATPNSLVLSSSHISSIFYFLFCSSPSPSILSFVLSMNFAVISALFLALRSSLFFPGTKAFCRLYYFLFMRLFSDTL